MPPMQLFTERMRGNFSHSKKWQNDSPFSNLWFDARKDIANAAVSQNKNMARKAQRKRCGNSYKVDASPVMGS